MSSLRQRIAERLVLAQHTAAILTTFNEADMSAILTLRANHKEAFKAKHGVDLGFLSFFVKSAVAALKAVPALNAQIQGNELVQNHFYDIAVAISSDRGLVTPVLRDCDRLGMPDLERAIALAAKKVRERTVTLDELTGGVFTVSNTGVFGGLLGTPILNPPQSGILGVYAIKRRPVAVEERVEIRPMAYLALSYDHRLVDGKEASEFLTHAARALEHPDPSSLEI
jgi:2-oxoglutarate dehydrogenase E2 component (dihydrolipoamide succinyltransferase)